MYRLLALSSLLASFSAFADREVYDHAPIRLDDRGYSMEHVAVRNQLGIGDCYAHAAAQMYDAWRFRLGDTDYKNQSSGLEINQRFKWYRGEKEVNSGKVNEVVPRLSEIGTCSEADLNKRLKGITVDSYATKVLRIYKTKAECFKETVLQRLMESPLPRSARTQDWVETRRRIEQETREVIVAESKLDLEQLHRKYLEPKYHYDYERISNIDPDPTFTKDIIRIFETIGVLACPTERIKAPRPLRVSKRTHYFWGVRLQPGPSVALPMPEKTYGRFSPLARIHAELDRGTDALPIAIGYCAGVLTEGRAYKEVPMGSEDCHGHASLIIGRREDPKVPGRGQLLIRNTWGTRNCDSYHKDWGCREDGGVRGSVWVDENVLVKAMYETFTIVR